MTPLLDCRRFLELFPGGFADPACLGSDKLGRAEIRERNYKLRALGNGQAEQLRASRELDVLAERVYGVVSEDINLLSHFETMAGRLIWTRSGCT